MLNVNFRWDVNDSAYWYFYGTRLYREDVIRKGKPKKKKGKESKKRGWFYGDDWLDDEETERVWQVQYNLYCFRKFPYKRKLLCFC